MKLRALVFLGARYVLACLCAISLLCVLSPSSPHSPVWRDHPPFTGDGQLLSLFTNWDDQISTDAREGGPCLWLEGGAVPSALAPQAPSHLWGALFHFCSNMGTVPLTPFPEGL